MIITTNLSDSFSLFVVFILDIPNLNFRCWVDKMQLNNEYILDRRKIINNELSERTPNIVILELISAFRIKIEKDFKSDPSYLRAVVRTIRSADSYKIKYPFNEADRAKIADYLSIPKTELKHWNNELLRKILSYWEMMISKIDYLPDIISTRIGYPTIKYPYSINACFLYRFCFLRKVEIPFNIEIKNLGLIVSMFSGSRAEILSYIQSQFTMTNNKHRLLSMLANIELKENNSIDILTSEDDQDFTHEILIIKYKKMVKIRGVEFRQPRNNLEAIVLAAINLKANLIFIDDPISEYKNLNQHLQKSPEDIYFLKYTALDRKVRLGYSLSLINFDSRLPEIFYPEQFLRSMSDYNGRGLFSEHNPYEYMQILSITETFYHCWHPNISNKETPFLYDEIKSINFDNLICYGVPSSNLIGITLDELISIFRINKSFRNDIIPDKNQRNFTEENINRLKRLLRRSPILNNQKSIDCLEEINRIEILNQDSSNKLRELLNIYPNNKIIIDQILDLYFDLGLYMRSWNGDRSSYPIEEAPVENQNLTDINVTNQINKIKEFPQKDILTIIEDLPIFKYEDGKFIPDNDENQGLTIAGRMKIVLQDESNINSCIRMTSNYLLLTIYRIKNVLSLDLPFNLSKFRFIA